MSPVTAIAATVSAVVHAANSSAAPAPAPSVVPANGTTFPELQPFFGNNTQWADHTAQDDPSFFPTLNASQHPSIVWIGCSDSRVPESVITKQPPGSIFTHRNIANQIQPTDWSAHAVVEYATAHLNVSHVVVVGHTNCGGAAAAFAAPNPDANETVANACPTEHDEEEDHGEKRDLGAKGHGKKNRKGKKGGKEECPCFTADQVEPGTEPGLDQFLAPLIKLRHTLPEGATVNDLIVANVEQSVNNLVASNAVKNAWEENRRLCVHGWLYDIGTGLLKDLGFSQCE